MIREDEGLDKKLKNPDLIFRRDDSRRVRATERTDGRRDRAERTDARRDRIARADARRDRAERAASRRDRKRGDRRSGGKRR